MPGMSVRHLYLTRHAEPDDDGTLTERGVHQAGLLGRRLSKVHFGSVQHGPLPRATETAHIVARQIDGQVPMDSSTRPGTTSLTCRPRTRSTQNTGSV